MADMGGISMGGLMGLVILIVVAAALVPTAITSLNDTNTTGWSDGEVAIWGILGLVTIAGLAFGIWKVAT